MVRKVARTKTLDGSVKAPISLVLQTVEISKCSVERKLPRFKAPQGKLESELNLNVHIADGDAVRQKGVIGLLSVVLNGKNASEDGPVPFSITFEMEGFYQPKDPNYALHEKDLTDLLAMRIASELYPLAMMRTSEFLSMIGYGGVRLSYGLNMEKEIQTS